MHFPLSLVLLANTLSVISTQLYFQKLKIALTPFNYNYYQNINDITDYQYYNQCIITIHSIDYSAKLLS